MHGCIFNLSLAVCFLAAGALLSMYQLSRDEAKGWHHPPKTDGLEVDGLCETSLGYL